MPSFQRDSKNLLPNISPTKKLKTQEHTTFRVGHHRIGSFTALAQHVMVLYTLHVYDDGMGTAREPRQFLRFSSLSRIDSHQQLSVQVYRAFRILLGTEGQREGAGWQITVSFFA